MLAKCSTAVRVSQSNTRYVSGDLFGMNTAKLPVLISGVFPSSDKTFRFLRKFTIETGARTFIEKSV